jgi:hypothetical protein
LSLLSTQITHHEAQTTLGKGGAGNREHIDKARYNKCFWAMSLNLPFIYLSNFNVDLICTTIALWSGTKTKKKIATKILHNIIVEIGEK